MGTGTRKLILGTLVLVLGAAGASAGATHGNTRSGGYMLYGGGIYDVDKLNSRLNDIGAPDISPYYLSLGVGKTTTWKRLVFDRHFEVTWYRAGKADSTAAALFSLSGLATVGIDLLPSEKIALYPYAGFGLGAASIEIRGDTQDFESFTAQPREPLRMYQGTVLLDGGVGFDSILPREIHGRNMHLGVKAGYRFDPTVSTDWRSGKLVVENGPSLRLSGAYAQVVIGWAYGKKDADNGCPGRKCGDCCKDK